MGLADRLNLHFKLGILGIVTVPFSEDEKVFVDRMETTDTFEDVVDLARDLYEKAKMDQEKTDPNMMDIQIGVSGEPINGEENEDGQEMPMPDSIEPETSDVFQKIRREQKKENRWDTDDEILLPTPKLDNMIVQPDKIAGWWDYHLSSNSFLQENAQNIRQECVSWMRNESSTVKNLVKQFEMRKAADEHKRTLTSKSGRLDTVKMIDYKWSEDIFAKNTIVREGKNHGIVIFVDWSGSMCDVIEPVMKQAITLAMFAQQANIPFEVFAFSDRGDSRSYYDENDTFTAESVWNQDAVLTYNSPEAQKEDGEVDYDLINNSQKGKASRVRLFRFLHSGMNRRDFQSAAEIFFLSAVGNCYGRENCQISPPLSLQLNGTPLDDCILAAHEVLMNFRHKNNLQVVNCAMLTDGQGASQGLCGVSLKNPYTEVVYGDRPEHRDNDALNRPRLDSTSLLLLSLKETTGCNLIGMYLHSGRNYNQAYGWVKEPDYSRWDSAATVNKTQQSLWKNENFCIADGRNADQYDEAYVIAAGTKIEQDMDLPDANTVSHVKLRNTFVKNLKKKGMSRTLIRRFVEMIAR